MNQLAQIVLTLPMSQLMITLAQKVSNKQNKCECETMFIGPGIDSTTNQPESTCLSQSGSASTSHRDDGESSLSIVMIMGVP